MAVSVDTGASFRAGKPQRLFAGPYRGESQEAAFDVSPDSRRFLMITFSFESERVQFIAGGTRCFTSSDQFSTALICRKVAASSLLIIKNRRLSGETSNAASWLSPR